MFRHPRSTICYPRFVPRPPPDDNTRVSPPAATHSMRTLLSIFALLVAAVGWYYLF